MKQLQALLGHRLRENEPLARYTAARLGGPADWLYVSNAKNLFDELIEVATTAWSMGLPVQVLGGGANVLVSDAGVRGLVIVNRINDIEFGEWHDGRNVSATSGTSLMNLARRCQQAGLTGMEWAVSVPGTVGGAVITNAGAHGSDMAQTLGDVVVLEAGKGPQLYSCDELEYDYRHSILKARSDRRFLVLLATFALAKEEPAAIQERMDSFRAYRKETQPPGASLGSIFKNPPGDYAGRLIDAAGLKGYQIGNVQVSPVHANFFINTGDATAADYYALIRHVQGVVAQKMDVQLELEIEVVGDWDSTVG